MTKSIDFYFDFISPYSYLAHHKLKDLNESNQINIIYKPILLGGLHNLGGITAPAFNERKLKNMKTNSLTGLVLATLCLSTLVHPLFCLVLLLLSLEEN